MAILKETEIKQFAEFDEVSPESSQNMITDKGRFTVGALYKAVAANMDTTEYRALKLKVFSAAGTVTNTTAYLVAQLDDDGLLNFSLLNETEYLKLK